MKNVFLTGGSSGIGACFKQHLESQQYTVVAPGRNELNLSNFDVALWDLSNYDCLLLCAGVDTNGRTPLTAMTSEDITNTMVVNTLSNMRLVHKYIQQRQGWGKIIAIGSIIIDGIPAKLIPYGVSKVALDAFLSALKKELTNTQIGICQIHPGPVRTNFNYNRGNVAESQRYALYDSMPHLVPEDLIMVLDDVLADQEHKINSIKMPNKLTRIDN